MKRFVESCALCLLMSACFHADAMPLGVRTLLHGHAMARQSAEIDPPSQAWILTFDVNDGWTQQVDRSWKSDPTADGATNALSATVGGSGTIAFRWKTSCEGYFNFKGMLIRQDGLSFIVDGEEIAFANGIMSEWVEGSFSIEGTGSHTLTWCYIKDVSGSDGEDCAWIDAVTWVPDESSADGVAIQVDGTTTVFEMAADGKTRTAEVAAGTAAEDVKVFVGGVDVTAGFKVSVEGTTATVVLKEPYETARSGSAPYQENDDDTTVTLNVEVVPGLYYAADSAATIEALKRPGAVEPAKAGDAVVAPKQKGSQGFYKVWVSDAPIEAE